MKVFLLGFLLSSSSFASLVKPCAVYGISDSPQNLSCKFAGVSIRVTCLDGKYFLNESRVKAAYHYEVEEGPTPLVFETAGAKLIVTMDRPVTATYEQGKAELSGICDN